MPDAIRQDFTLFRGEDRDIVVTMNADGSIAGWESALYIREQDTSSGSPLLAVDGSITDAGSVSAPGVLTFSITEADLLALEKRRYYYTVKRTNTGSKRVLVYGVINVFNDGEHEP